MMTYSGVLIERDGSGVPTFHDVARSLARLPRFVGHTSVAWSVAAHSLLCLALARKMGVTRPELLALVLLHDAHECVTGDVPTLWKTPDLRAAQAELDERFYRAWGLWDARGRDGVLHMIKAIDRRALAVEARMFAALGIERHWSIPPCAAGDPEILSALAYELRDEYVARVQFLAELALLEWPGRPA